MFDLAEEAFDQVAFFVDGGIEAAPCGSGGSARDDRFCACGGDGIHCPLSVIAFVSQNMGRLDPVKQRFDLRNVVALATCQDEANGVAKGVGGGMDLGAQTTF